ncbi:MAG: glycosyltransferase family 2 protein [Actinomycetota bacterium]|nr:glycosyltransferase family 2 protein [Actinomycetota bacterium]
MSDPAAWPSVGVVIPAHDRPDQLRAALAAVRGQDYPGPVRTVVVFDRSEPDATLAAADVTVLANERTPGLAGARNSGILALGTDLVAFCDDDDQWLPGKLTAQVRALLSAPGAEFASCGIIVEYNGTPSPRLAGADRVSYADLLRSRMVMVHSSTYLVRRAALLDGIGLVDEQIPGGQNEDWDLALRAARRHPIVQADDPLVRVAWGSSSYFARQWESKAAALKWMLDRHPDIRSSRLGSARVYGQLAFAYACLGQRREAGLWAVRAVRQNWHERRVPFALAVASGAVSGEMVLRMLHKRGHGI